MAGSIVAQTSAEVALVAATAKTVLQIVAGASKPLEVYEWWVDFDGTAPTNEHVTVKILRKSAAGTAGSSVTPVAKKGAAPLFTAGQNYSAEGTLDAEVYSHNVHPQDSKHVIWSLGDEIDVPVSGILAIQCTAPAGVNVRAGFGVREG